MRKEETSGQKQIYRTFALTFDQTKKLHVQEPCKNRFCFLLLFEVQKNNRFLEICHRDP